ncbi:hypothetical protein [Streptomyces flavidovirens]
MTIAQDLRTRARHRGLTPWQLVQKIGRLEREADDLTCQMVALSTENGELRAARNELEAQLDTAGIDLSGVREDLAAAERELVELRAFKANVTSVDVPAGHRDIDPDDQPTGTIPVKTLQAALNTAVTNPGQTTWGARNQQQEVQS